MKRALWAAMGLLLAGAAQAEVTLRLMTGASNETAPVIERLIAEFEARNPGVRVKLERVPEERDRKLLTQFAAGVAPDVFTTSVNTWRRFAYRGIFLPVDELRDRYGMEIDPGRWYPNLQSFYTWDGRLWALPTSTTSPMLVYYNRRLLREAGIPEPDGSWTWDARFRPELREKDFMWVIQRLTKLGPNGRATQWGFASSWPQLFADSLIRTRGLRLWDDDERPTRVVATQPEMVETMQFAADLVNRHRIIPSFAEVQQGMGSTMDNEFMKGRLAMLLSGSWVILNLRRDAPADLDWDVAPFPAFAGRPFEALSEGNCVAVIRGTRHPREAWKLAQFMAGEELQIELAKLGENQPAFRDLATRPGVWLAAPGDEARQRPENMAITDRLAMSMTLIQTPEYFDPVRNEVQGTFFQILTNRNDVRESLQRLEDQNNRRLKLVARREDRPPFPWVPALAIGTLLVAALAAWVYLPERQVRYSRRDKAQSRRAYLFLIPWLFGLALTLGPMVYSLLLSFSDSDLIRPARWVGLDNYADAFTADPLFWQSLWVTAYYCLLSIPTGMISALGLALILNQPVKGIPLYRACFYIPSLAGGVAMSLLWMQVFNPENGLVNRLIFGAEGENVGKGLAGLLSRAAGVPGETINWFQNEITVMPTLVFTGLWGAGAGCIIFLAGLQGINPSFQEAAKLDGAGVWTQFRRITLPLLSPTVFFVLVTSVIGAFQVFTQAYVITAGGPNNQTMFYMLNLFNHGFRDLRMGYASALAWVLFVIVLALTAAQVVGARRWVHYEGEVK
ncbi:MAG: extracellular solute-binding protein [Fimbriimonadaceae bacterium]|nr:extracellular solute-binding protein [Fimbriimonadaceae bacterium]